MSRFGVFKYFLPVLAFVFLVGAPCPVLAQGGGGPCDLRAARVFANMFEDSMPPLVQNIQPTRPINDPHPRLVTEVKDLPVAFSETAPAIQCGKALGRTTPTTRHPVL
jgi:hypothetical protein